MERANRAWPRRAAPHTTCGRLVIARASCAAPRDRADIRAPPRPLLISERSSLVGSDGGCGVGWRAGGGPAVGGRLRHRPPLHLGSSLLPPFLDPPFRAPLASCLQALQSGSLRGRAASSSPPHALRRPYSDVSGTRRAQAVPGALQARHARACGWPCQVTPLQWLARSALRRVSSRRPRSCRAVAARTLALVP
jgi:hypothetical protein